MSPPKTGRVLLVGAGPGDPELITVRGANALREADVVVYDALAATSLLNLAPPEAERINVGKRGHDEPTRSQEDTTALLLRLASEGKTVVRLKGGDPYVFGRGGEEASACADAGIDFEVVPGVSSVMGALAYAGIPVTDRRHSASFAVVTGHKDPTRVSEETRWQELAHAADTLVILMGMRNLESIVAKLISGGRGPATPAAAVMHGTLPAQRVVESRLSELPEAVERAGLGAPSVVVVGDVVALREKLAWFECRPLFGKRVVVTRAARQAGDLVDALHDAGAEPVVIPTIRFAPPEDPAPLDAALDELDRFDWVVFTSANAANLCGERARERGHALRDASLACACVGPATADEARELGLPVTLQPAEQFDAEGLLDAFRERGGVAGQQVLIPQADGARALLADGLTELGARVTAVTCYRTVAADVDAEALRDQLVAGELHVLTFTSPSTARHFVGHLDEEALKVARRCVIAAIGPVTADALRELGLEPDVVPERATARDLVAAIAAHGTADPGGER